MLALIQLVKTLFDAYTVVIIARALMSFVITDPYNPIMNLLIAITEPVLAPIRRLLPSTGGLDFSPLIALIAIQLLESIVISLLAGGVR